MAGTRRSKPSAFFSTVLSPAFFAPPFASAAGFVSASLTTAGCTLSSARCAPAGTFFATTGVRERVFSRAAPDRAAADFEGRAFAGTRFLTAAAEVFCLRVMTSWGRTD